MHSEGKYSCIGVLLLIFVCWWKGVHAAPRLKYLWNTVLDARLSRLRRCLLGRSGRCTRRCPVCYRAREAAARLSLDEWYLHEDSSGRVWVRSALCSLSLAKWKWSGSLYNRTCLAGCLPTSQGGSWPMWAPAGNLCPCRTRWNFRLHQMKFGWRESSCSLCFHWICCIKNRGRVLDTLWMSTCVLCSHVKS